MAGATMVLWTVCLAACGGAGSPKPVVRVGGQSITMTMLAHWTAALKTGWAQAGQDPETSLEGKALSLLIAFRWLIGEAERRNISISEHEVRRQIDVYLRHDFPGSVAELRQFLKPTGETPADLKLQARAQLAKAKLGAMAIAAAGHVTKTDIAAYYAQHKRDFVVLEHREARFQNPKTRAEALKIKREAEAGKGLTSPGQRKVGELYTGASVPPKNEYEKVIDLVKPHTIAGPFKIGNDYWVYEVVKITPARQKSLAEVSASIARSLESERRQSAEAAFVKEWTGRWSPLTDCISGYVVQGCRQRPGTVGEADKLPQV